MGIGGGFKVKKDEDWDWFSGFLVWNENNDIFVLSLRKHKSEIQSTLLSLLINDVSMIK